MDMEQPAVTTPEIPVKPKRKGGRPRKAKAPAADAPQFEGITANNCCLDCDEKHCVISGKAYCAHPYKGGLHSDEMLNAKAMRRSNDAKLVLTRQRQKD